MKQLCCAVELLHVILTELRAAHARTWLRAQNFTAATSWDEAVHSMSPKLLLSAQPQVVKPFDELGREAGLPVLPPAQQIAETGQFFAAA